MMDDPLLLFYVILQLLISLIMSSNVNFSVLLSRHRLLFYLALYSLPVEVSLDCYWYIFQTSFWWSEQIEFKPCATWHFFQKFCCFLLFCSVFQNHSFKMWMQELNNTSEYKSEYHLQIQIHLLALAFAFCFFFITRHNLMSA